MINQQERDQNREVLFDFPIKATVATSLLNVIDLFKFVVLLKDPENIIYAPLILTIIKMIHMPLIVKFSIKNNRECNSRDIQDRNNREWEFYQRLELENARRFFGYLNQGTDENHFQVQPQVQEDIERESQNFAKQFL